jgi:pimeloyl-ACP methyl ester carboxylesterase
MFKDYVKLTNGETLCYKKHGNGKRVLMLIHGNMSSSVHWRPVMDALPEGYTAYAPDLRGFGESTYNHPIETLGDFAQDLVLFAKELGLEQITPVGWSTGGGVAMHLAAEYPELVENLVLMETVGHTGYPIFKKDEQGQPLVGQHYATKEEMAADPVQVAPMVTIFQQGNSALMRAIWDQLIWVGNKPSEEEYVESIGATMLQRNLVDVDWALATFNMSHDHNGVAPGNGLVDKITVPTLAFWGDKDYVVPRPMVEGTVEAIGDNARLVVLENCGHSPITDALETVMAEIILLVEGE